MIVRFAKNEDVPAILALLQQVGRLHHEGRPDLFRSDAQKYGASQVIRMLEDPDQPIFIAAEEDAVLGYGFCQIKTHTQNPVFHDYTELYIDDICVDKTQRSKGGGSAIYEEILRYGKKRKCHNITLNVWSFNKQAMAFYEKCGLKPQRIFMETVLENQDA